MLPEAPPILPEQAASFITRRYCTVLGGLIFTICYVLILFGAVANCFVTLGPGEAVDTGRPFLNMLYIGVPIVALLGAVVGFELHRLATRAREPFPSQWYIWVAAFFFVSPLTLFLLPLSRRRRTLIVEGKPPSNFLPVCYGLLIIATFFIPLRPSRVSEMYYLYAGLPAFLGLFLADSLVVNKIAVWNQQLRLAAADNQKFQFALSTLFYGSLLIGVYFTGLVLILRR